MQQLELTEAKASVITKLDNEIAELTSELMQKERLLATANSLCDVQKSELTQIAEANKTMRVKYDEK